MCFPHKWSKWTKLFPSLGSGSIFQTRRCLKCDLREEKIIVPKKG